MLVLIGAEVNYLCSCCPAGVNKGLEVVSQLRNYLSVFKHKLLPSFACTFLLFPFFICTYLYLLTYIHRYNYLLIPIGVFIYLY